MHGQQNVKLCIITFLVLFHTFSNIIQSIGLLEPSQASLPCHSEKGHIKMKISMERWWNDTRKNKSTRSKNSRQCYLTYLRFHKE
jgi:hypothetical protein